MIIDSAKLRSAEFICPDDGVTYIIICENHVSLEVGDAVVMREVRYGGSNYFVRKSDLTIHKLVDKDGSYIVVVPKE